mmetsp:Transcript_5505/g.12343  ORF Transcript_5505/g.12343 Transcript_5505/m.12343 type:complete len:171 (-) Transcript_5505:67-579(-)
MTSSSSSSSPLSYMTCRIKVNIPPWQLANIPVAVHTHLHTLLFRYSDGLDAVIINITDVAIEQHKPPHVATFAPTVHVYAQAKLLLFQPNRGQILHGVVTKVGHDYCAIKTLGVFNATVSRKDVDTSKFSEQNQLVPGTEVRFAVKDVNHEGGFFSLTGALNKENTGPVV